MPKLVRLYIQSVALGLAIAAGFTGALLWLDVAGLGHLILGSNIGWIAVAMLVLFNGIVFSAVQFAFRVMGLAETGGPPPGGRGARASVSASMPVSAPVKVRARR